MYEFYSGMLYEEIMTSKTYDGKLRIEIYTSKLGKGVVILNLIDLETGEIMQKTRDVNFLIRRLWDKKVLRRKGWL